MGRVGRNAAPADRRLGLTACRSPAGQPAEGAPRYPDAGRSLGRSSSRRPSFARPAQDDVEERLGYLGHGHMTGVCQNLDLPAETMPESQRVLHRVQTVMVSRTMGRGVWTFR